MPRSNPRSILLRVLAPLACLTLLSACADQRGGFVAYRPGAPVESRNIAFGQRTNTNLLARELGRGPEWRSTTSGTFLSDISESYEVSYDNQTFGERDGSRFDDERESFRTRLLIR